MTARDRIGAVLAGQKPDRPPVSFWHHFPPDARAGRAAVDAHLKFLARFDLDFVKVMNDNPYPCDVTVRSASDLSALPVLEGTEEGFDRQLDLIRALAAEVGERVPLVATIFNAWAVMRFVAVPRTDPFHHPPDLSGQMAPRDERMAELIAEDRTAVRKGLDTVARSLANFARRCIEAGADGIFLSVRDEFVSTKANGPETYDELVRPGDHRILSAASEGSLNILHVCGHPRDFAAFTDYPVHAVNWADRAAGPAIAEVVGQTRPAICGGVDNLSTLPEGKPADVVAEVHDAVRQAGDRPIIIAPGCTFDPEKVPEENLEAMLQAAWEAKY
jgi:uroporphyrinogen decarboxylase